MELYVQAHHLGWDLVSSLRHLRLTRWRAEMLLLRLEWLDQYVRQKRQSQQQALAMQDAPRRTHARNGRRHA